jgi:TonB family protein
MNPVRFDDSPTEFAPANVLAKGPPTSSPQAPPEDSGDVTLIRGRPSNLKPSIDTAFVDADDVDDSPIARLILSKERSHSTRPAPNDSSLRRKAIAVKGLPVAVLTNDETFATQLRQALEPASDVSVVSSADEAEQLAASGQCPILVTDITIARSAIEELKTRLRAHDASLTFIVAGSRDQGGMLIGLQSSGAIDGFLLKPATAAATQLVVESATKRHRTDTNTGTSKSVRGRARSSRERANSISRADVTELARPTIEAHAAARNGRTVAPQASAAPVAEPNALRPSWLLMIAAVVVVAGAVWWIMWQRLPTIDPDRVIAEQLMLADDAQEAGRWIGPRSSAAYHYQTVLALDPQNLAAQRGLDRVAAELSRQTQSWMSQKRLPEAAMSLERLRELQPDYAELPLLDSQFRALRDSVLATLTPAPNTTATPTERTETTVPARQRAASRPAERATSADRATVNSVAQQSRPTVAAPIAAPSIDAPSARAPAASTARSESTVTAEPKAAASPRSVAAMSQPAPPALTPSLSTSSLPSNAATSADRAASTVPTTTPAAARTAPVVVDIPSATLAANTSAPTARPDGSARADGPPAIEPTRAPPVDSAAPKIQKYVPPVYPSEAFTRGIEGWIQVSLDVTPSGNVVNARIDDGEKRQLFSRAALAAVKQWQYEARPQASGETPVTVRLDFKLQR